MADQTQPMVPQQQAPVAAPAEPAAAPSSPEVPQTTASPVAEDEKFFAALAYFGPLFVITLVVKPKSDFCKFHARQSMVLFLIFILFLMVLFAIPWFGSLMTFVLFAVYVLAIYRAYKGDLWNIPVVSKFAGKMNVEMLYSKAGLAVSGISGLKEKAAGLAEQAAKAAQSLGKQEEGPQAQPPAAQPPPPLPPAQNPPEQTPPATPPQF